MRAALCYCSYFMKVIPLGTSSGKPTLKRNVSALAVVREAEWLLFDCGEGTQMQIPRARINPTRLAAIFITHLHGDHFNGLAGFLSTMGLDRREKGLSLIGPRGIRQYLDLLASLKILYVNYPLALREFGARGIKRRIEAAEPEWNYTARLADFTSETASTDELTLVYEAAEYAVSARPLDHRIFALGYRVEELPRPGRFNLEKARALGIPEGPLFGRLQAGADVQLADGRVIRPSDVLGPPRQGKAVAYCTDTRPCAASIELARDVDLLIHEATFTEDLADEAREFGHSTAAQAARIARDAGARRLLITHFSSRYPDATPLLEEARAIFPETILAEDLMEIDV